jgi:hypothetical protein
MEKICLNSSERFIIIWYLISYNVIFKASFCFLRRIFGPMRDEVTGERRNLHNEELPILHSSPNTFRQIKSRRLRWVGHVACIREDWNVYQVLMGKPEGKRPLGRSSHKWEDGLRMDLREIGWGSINWIQLAQDMDQWWAFVNTVMDLRVLAPQN